MPSSNDPSNTVPDDAPCSIFVSSWTSVKYIPILFVSTEVDVSFTVVIFILVSPHPSPQVSYIRMTCRYSSSEHSVMLVLAMEGAIERAPVTVGASTMFAAGALVGNKDGLASGDLSKSNGSSSIAARY